MGITVTFSLDRFGLDMPVLKVTLCTDGVFYATQLTWLATLLRQGHIKRVACNCVHVDVYKHAKVKIIHRARLWDGTDDAPCI